MKQLVKDTIRKLIWAAGYEVIWRNEPGRNHLNDIESFLGKNSIEIVLDVGAHFGESALEFRKRFPNSDVYCFEPSPDSFEKLAENAGKDRRIRAYNVALGEKSGKVRLNRNSASATNSILELSQDANKHVIGGSIKTMETCETELSTLDAFAEEQKLSKIDLLKIDTQGYELNVLRGAENAIRMKKVRAVFAEMAWAPIYSGQANFEDVFGFFRAHGYRFAGLYGIVRGADRTLSWCDGLFIA